jgi:ribonuclease T
MPANTDMATRFRGYLPVVVDFETGGFDPQKHAILEVGMVHVGFTESRLTPGRGWRKAVHPYAGSSIDPASLKVTGIDPEDPDRGALDEKTVLQEMFADVRSAMKEAGCQRAILVAHNAAFDQQFLTMAVLRNELKRSPFHPFSFIDTASLAAVAFGHTVLSEACKPAHIDFDSTRAHSALYDAERTAELFCEVVNRWQTIL